MSFFLTLGLTILASKTEMQIVLSYKCTVGTPLWSARASMYLCITLVFLTALYMHIISPSVESDYISG